MGKTTNEGGGGVEMRRSQDDCYREIARLSKTLTDERNQSVSGCVSSEKLRQDIRWCYGEYERTGG